MSLFRQAVKAAITNGAPGALRDVRQEHLLEEEQGLFRFVFQHLQQHGSLPTEETLTRNEYPLVRADEPVSYYLAEMRRRYAYNLLKDPVPRLSQLMLQRDVEGIESLMRECISEIGSTLRPRSYSSLATALDMVLDDYEYAKTHPGLRGVTFGWATPDELTLGAMGGDFIVIAGRPSMGKSWLLEHCAYAAQMAGKSSIVISMEMPIIQMARRRIGRDTGINPNFIRGGKLSRWAEEKLYERIEALKRSAAPVHFLSGDASKEVSGIADMAAEYAPDIIYIDSAYLLSPTLRKQGGYASGWEELKDVIREIKALSLSINRPIVGTFQFNRNVKKRTTKRLDLGDIAGTDAIPQDASIVFGVREGMAPFEQRMRHVEMLKNREGEVRDFPVHFSFYPINFRETVYPTQDGQTIASSDWMI